MMDDRAGDQLREKRRREQFQTMLGILKFNTKKSSTFPKREPAYDVRGVAGAVGTVQSSFRDISDAL